MINQISGNVHALEFQNFGSIAYLIKLPNQNILVDTSSKENAKELIHDLKELSLTPENITTIILTHPHYDHVENINIFPHAKIYSDFTKQINIDHSQTEIKKILPIKNFPLAQFVSINSAWVGGRFNAMRGRGMEKPFKIYKTPGHTGEDIIILYKNILFSGDVVFHNGYIGRTDFPESNPNQMQKSLEFIKTLKFEILAPGH